MRWLYKPISNPVKKASAPLFCLLLGGCVAQSDVQADYMGYESLCRDEAERTAERLLDAQRDTPIEGEVGAQEAAFAAATAFSQCMHNQGWKVAVPKSTKPREGELAPTVTPGAATNGTPRGAHPATQPHAAPPAPVARTAPNAAPVVQPAIQPAPPPVTPPSAQSSVVPSSPPPPLRVSPPVSTYQPARPAGSLRPRYGEGAGRQF